MAVSSTQLFTGTLTPAARNFSLLSVPVKSCVEETAMS